MMHHPPVEKAKREEGGEKRGRESGRERTDAEKRGILSVSTPNFHNSPKFRCSHLTMWSLGFSWCTSFVATPPPNNPTVGLVLSE